MVTRGSQSTSAPTCNEKLIQWVRECGNLCQPDRTVWINGSPGEKKRLEDEAVATGEIMRLDEKKLPGCFYSRSHPNDVARTEGLTYICTNEKDDAGPTNNWMSPEDGYRKASEIFSGSMKGRTMYVIPFSMGPVGSEFSKIGVQVTDSIYVVLNMKIMTRVGDDVLKALGENDEFTKCLHGKAELDIKRRLILHFPHDNAIWSVGSGYGGNALLGKKCMALRIASFLGRKEGWMAEHMLILGIQRPDGKVFYAAAAFPSACGKTNMAMLVPPDNLREKGYRVWTVGDDIAWLRIGPDGHLRAVNPEYGFFGVVPGTNSKSNPNAVKTIKRNTIFTNVALKPDNTVWWEGSDDGPPEKATNWKDEPWKPGMIDHNGNPIKAAHPNSRFTAPASQCPAIAPNWEDPAGVPISAIIFGGRRTDVVPLIHEAFSWNHGVYMGATLSSDKTSAQEGKVGELRRDPMAMIPFCGYNMGDYFRHWIEMGKKIPRPPKIFHVNWFRLDEKGELIWPGFRNNLRVLDWILDRCENNVNAAETSVGYVPRPDDINLNGLDLPPGTMETLLSIDSEAWKNKLDDQKKFFSQFGPRFPDELWNELKLQRERLFK